MKTKPKIKIDLKQVEEFAKVCDTDEEIAYNLGISVTTFYQRKRENEDFVDAIKRGKAKAKSYVVGKLMKAVENGNSTAMIFWLKAKGGWKETDKQEIEVNQPVQIVVKNDLKD